MERDDRWRRLYRLRRNRRFVAGSAILVLYLGVAGYAIARFRNTLNYVPSHLSVLLGEQLAAGPTLQLYPFSLGAFPLGETGGFGFNVAEGLVKGTPWDLMIFTLILVPSTLTGVLVGTISGHKGGLVDEMLMGVTDVVLSIPPFIVGLLLFVTLLSELPSDYLLPVFISGMVAILWAPTARLVRAKARTVTAQPFVEAAVAGGASRSRVMFRHVMPNSFTPALSQVPVTLSNTVALMTVLPYIGIYTSDKFINFPSFLPSTNFPEWTWMLVNGLLGWSPLSQTDDWWGYICPLAWITVFALGVTFFTDGLGEFLAPSS